jgi:hypothetical protein
MPKTASAHPNTYKPTEKDSNGKQEANKNPDDHKNPNKDHPNKSNPIDHQPTEDDDSTESISDKPSYVDDTIARVPHTSTPTSHNELYNPPATPTNSSHFLNQKASENPPNTTHNLFNLKFKSTKIYESPFLDASFKQPPEKLYLPPALKPLIPLILSQHEVFTQHIKDLININLPFTKKYWEEKRKLQQSQEQQNQSQKPTYQM